MSEEVKIIDKENNLVEEKTPWDEDEKTTDNEDDYDESEVDSSADKPNSEVLKPKKDIDKQISDTFDIIAAFFALFGVFAVCYRLYSKNGTWEAWVDASITLAQILTVSAVLVSSVIKLSKMAKKKDKQDTIIDALEYEDNLTACCEKYNGLIKIEPIAKKYKGEICKYYSCSMFLNHADIANDDKKDKKYVEFAKLPMVNIDRSRRVSLSRNQVLFYVPNKWIKGTDVDGFIDKLLNLRTSLNNRYGDIMGKDITIKSTKKIGAALRHSRKYKNMPYVIDFQRPNKTIIHIYLRNEADNNEICKNIIDMLDFMVMANLAIA